jgi:hypothetical protein
MFSEPSWDEDQSAAGRKKKKKARLIIQFQLYVFSVFRAVDDSK